MLITGTPKHSRNISHVMIHEVADGMLLKGTKKEVASIVFLILSGVQVFQQHGILKQRFGFLVLM